MGTTLITDTPGGAGVVATVVGQVSSVASNATDTGQPICRCKNAGSVLSAFFIPSASQAGSATNYRTPKLINMGSAGTGTTVIASITALSASTGSVIANTAKAMTMTTTAADYTVAAGDILAWYTTKSGDGIAINAGDVQIDFM